jgi:tRNA(fMet)-specific endonuclease VapC
MPIPASISKSPGFHHHAGPHQPEGCGGCLAPHAEAAARRKAATDRNAAPPGRLSGAVLAYLIDTNIAIHARDGTDAVLAKLAEHDGDVLLSALSLAELQRGIYRDPVHTAIRQARLKVLLRGLPILPFDASAAEAYGLIIAQCGWAKGRDYDHMIAAHAISSGSVLVTSNAADFRDIPGLAMENWVV